MESPVNIQLQGRRYRIFHYLSIIFFISVLYVVDLNSTFFIPLLASAALPSMIAGFRFLNGRSRNNSYDLTNLRPMINTLSEPIYIINRKGTILLTNDADETIHSRPFVSLLHPDYISLFEEKLQLAKYTGSSQELYTDNIFHGAVKSVNRIIKISPISSDAFSVIMTENHSEQAHKTKETDEPANDFINQYAFLSNLSHELRTPMTGIMGMTDLVLSTELTPFQKENLHIVKSSSENLLSLLSEILDLAKLNTGTFELEKTRFRLRDIIDDSKKAVDSRAGKKDIRISYMISSKIPDVLIGDAGRIRKIISNLVSNSIKYTEKGSITLRIDKHVAKSEDGIVLLFSVTDTGIGIPKDRQELIFRSLEKTGSVTSRRYGGAGIGLSIAHKLVTLMNGEMWVESPSPFLKSDSGTPGSTFYFTLRLDHKDRPGEKSEQPNRLALLDGLRVLIYSDNEISARQLQRLIYQWEMSPRLFFDREKALEATRKAFERNEPFNLIIIDCSEYNTNCLEMGTAFRQVSKGMQIYCIAISSDFNDVYYKDFRENGIDRFLKQPAKPSELLDSIVSLVGRNITPDAEPSPVAETYSDPGTDSHPLNILLAEDNTINQKLAQRILKRLGHRTHIVQNGKEALEHWQTHEYDLILMDIQMPVMNGYEATSAIRRKEKQTGKHTPIIALTAQSMTGDRERSLANGMDGHISKPLDMESLAQEFKRIIPERALQ